MKNFTACTFFCLLFITARPRATLTAETTTIPVGGSVTLTCSVQNSVGWKYQWYRRTQRTSEVLVDPVRTNDEKNRVISVSQRGIYRCIGRRGKPDYYTDLSDSVTIEITFSNEAVLRRQPDWTQMFRGERITLTCEVHGGETTKWVYDWRGPGLNVDWKDENYVTFRVSESSSGAYMCRGRLRDDSYSSTEWSKAVTLSVSDKPKAVLTVSPSWLSPGTSVTLSCECKHPSAGWRFYWYQAVPDLSGTSYSYELLPGSINGTEQDSFIIHGQTQTAGFTCRAGRGDPEYYTDYSEPKFVWSGDLHSAASLTVNPDTVQHFVSKSVSLSCEGNSTKWRVRMLTGDGILLHCSVFGTMSGSTCNVNLMLYGTVVYWCESGSAFSNAVNITGQSSSPESSSFTVPLLIGLFSGVFLTMILVLLLLCCCRQIKDPHCNRLSPSQNMNQASAALQTVNQNETQTYSSLLHGDASAYETIRRSGNSGSDEPAHDYNNVTPA
ncbi:uncharacterized protein LOC110967514 isoform X2 [Acanthochromis polyacanthus]|uniref:uncharacterized protein LOC110967514 isoform X2 n=1 Tax=Acanthochromis polyacanthus TaxID=80966 RepID=UPI0022341A03|nr:uncharacterized protein LOC110967514 isoform X2 [Acanthochromis polyacanthus]